ncbi:LPS export ABC transporter permease LptG [uncultured Lentibacter sp.]|uniref:LPS export ABC transporter permease LptG n=1 Tax=uncultured Lentibacter sp. TaxID=1659309 RepID=UPI00260A421B|nr:LPS export ABC transporter permease LptG [uncultured Lentibacter sp.]MCW1954516.1 LPS export ABC transporter permease LptG [Roseobacter sp.]
MILHSYFIRKFLGLFFGLLLVFFLFQTLIDLVEMVRRFQGIEVPFSALVTLSLLNVPQGLYEIVPLVMILSTVALFLGLARSSELVVVRATGRSALRALIAPAGMAFVIGVMLVALFNPIVAATSKRAHDLNQELRDGSVDVLSLSTEGLWLRQGGAEGQTVIRAATTNPDATVLYDVTFLSYAPKGGPLKRVEAAEARLLPGAWELTDATVWPLSSGVNPEGNVARHLTLRISSTLTQERILESFGAPSAISVWDLPAFINQLQQAGFSTRRHAVWLQMELAQPLFLLAMVLVGAAFTMRHARGGGTGMAVLSSILLGFGLYYIRNFAQVLGENGQIPVMLAAWAPPTASVLLAWGLLLHMEDG